MANHSQSADFAIASLHSLRPRFRYYVAALALLVGLTIAWVSFEEGLHGSSFAAVAFGAVSFVAVVFLGQTLRRETSLIRDHVSAIGVVTETGPTRRGGAHIRYRFEALNGKQYEAESEWSVRGVKDGERIAVLYSTFQPEISRPLPGFIFYKFEDTSKT